jgi:YidC/Oxa1 family membrane protein insertase
MDRKTLIAVVVCLILFMAYPFLLRWSGLDRYMRPASTPAPSGPAATAPRDTGAAATPRRAAMDTTGSSISASSAPAPASGPGLPASVGSVPEQSIVVETPLYRAFFSNRGARLTRIELKRYAKAHGPSHQKGAHRPKPGEPWPEADRVVLGGDPTFSLDLGSGPNRRQFDRQLYAVAESLDASGATRGLRFTARTPDGATIQQSYRIRPDDYAIDLDVEIRDVPLNWRLDDYSLTTRSWELDHENDPLDEERSLKATSLVGTNHHHDLLGALRKGPKVFDGSVEWSAVQTRYFSAAVALVKGSAKSAVATLETRSRTPAELAALGAQASPNRETVTNSMVVSLPASGGSNRFLLYFGPNEYFRIAKLELGLDHLVDLGWSWIRPLSKLLLRVLNWLYGVIHNYGVAILLLATLVRLLLHPLGMMSIKSMRSMQRVQPEIDRLREKYKNDAQAMNTAMMALYKENKINPAGGCLPMLVQMPLFVALYSVLFNAIELRQAPFMLWMQDLSAPDLLFHVAGFPLRLLPVIMALSGVLQQRMTPTAPGQASTFYMMNAMMLVFFYNLPSGLVLYWTVMNLLTALQQWLALREDGGPLPVAPAPSRVAGRARSKVP